MSPTIASYIRSALKIGGAVLVTKGLTDEAGLEALIGGTITLIGIIWSHFSHKKS